MNWCLNRSLLKFIVLITLCGTLVSLIQPASATNPVPQSQPQPIYSDHEILFKLKQTYKINSPNENFGVGKTVPLNQLQADSLPPDLLRFLEKHAAVSIIALHPAMKLRQNHGPYYQVSLASQPSLFQITAEMEKLPSVAYAQPNYQYSTDVIPNDPYFLDSFPTEVQNRDPSWNPAYDYQWNLKVINAPAGWDLTTGSSDIIVAVIDSGVDYTHPDLGSCTVAQIDAGNCPLVTSGFDFVNQDQDPMDDNNHGTHVSGVISSSSDNSLGIAGLNWKTKIMPLKGLDRFGYGYTTTLAQAIYYAVDHGARIINASWGSYGTGDQILEDAITYAFENNVLFVTSAGNSNIDVALHTPANTTCVTPQQPLRDCTLTVAATDHTDVKAGYSNWGTGIDIAAPGGADPWDYLGQENILSLLSSSGLSSTKVVGSNYLRLSGTSMSAPHVSGLAALLLSMSPALSVDQLRNAILNGADDKDQNGFDIFYGFGRINVANTLTHPNPASPPIAKINSPAPGMRVSSRFILTGSATSDNFSNFKVEYSSGGSSFSSQGVSLAGDGLASITSGQLAQLDLSHLPDGIGQLKLTTTDTAGKSAYAQIQVDKDSSIRPNFPISYGGTRAWSTPIIDDINLDGSMELIYKDVSRFEINVLNSNGAVKSGWPQTTGENPTSYDWQDPIVFDFDKNYPGREVIALAAAGGGQIIEIFHADGTAMAGWARDDWNNRPVLGKATNLAAASFRGQPIIFYAETTPASGQTQSLLYAFGEDGSQLHNFPVTLPQPPNSKVGYFSSPRLADLTGDHEPEVVISGTNHITVVNLEGQIVATREFDSTLFDFFLGNIDTDGVSEIIALTQTNPDGTPTDQSVYVFDWALNPKAPFPISLPHPQTNGYVQSLYLGDFDHDQFADILVSTSKSQHYIYNYKGEAMLGYPKNLATGPYWASWGANVKTTKSRQLLAQTGNTANISSVQQLFLQEYNPSDGQLETVAGFPKTFDQLAGGFFYLSPLSLLDLDNDNRLELITAASLAFNHNYLYVFDIPRELSYPDWPQNFHDSARTGAYTSSLAVPPPSPTLTPTPTMTPTPTPTLSPTPSPTPAPTPPSLEETSSGAALNSSSVRTTASLSQDTSSLYLASISMKPSKPVLGVSGMGLTWNLLKSQCGGRSQTSTEVWYAFGNSTAATPVTATFNSKGKPKSAVISANLFRGVNQADPIGAVVSKNSNGINSTVCSGGKDQKSFSVDLITDSQPALIFSAVARRGMTFTPDPSFTIVDEIVSGGSTSNQSGISTIDKLADSPGTTNISGQFSKAVDYAVIGVEIR